MNESTTLVALAAGMGSRVLEGWWLVGVIVSRWWGLPVWWEGFGFEGVVDEAGERAFAGCVVGEVACEQ